MREEKWIYVVKDFSQLIKIVPDPKISHPLVPSLPMPLLNRINYNFFPGFLLNLCVCERLFVCMIFQKNDEGMRVCVCYQLYFNILPFVICIF